MATVYKRGNTYTLQWFERGVQQRKSIGRITKDEAEKFAREKEFELRTGRKIFTGGTLFEDHLVRYIDWHAVTYRSSHFRVKVICEEYLEEFYGRLLAEITQQDVEKWLAGRLTRIGTNRYGKQARMAAATVAKELTTLKAVFNKAVEWEKGFAKSPAEHVKKPKNLNSKPVHWYEATELAALFKDTLHAPIWRFMANTGIRRMEAQQLEWKHVNWDKGVINVESTERDRTKSGKWREIPLSAGAVLALKELKLKAGSAPRVLPRMAAASLSRAFRHDAQARKLGGSLHSLRHTYAAHLILANVPLRKVQALMGHASVVTTEQYAHIGEDHLRDQVKAVSL